MTTTQTIFTRTAAALALASALFAAAPASAGLTGRLDPVASTGQAGTGANLEQSAIAAPQVTEPASPPQAAKPQATKPQATKAEASEKRVRRDTDVTARRHGQATRATHVAHGSARRPGSTWNAVSYAAVTPVAFAAPPCHRR